MKRVGATREDNVGRTERVSEFRQGLACLHRLSFVVCGSLPELARSLAKYGYSLGSASIPVHGRTDVHARSGLRFGQATIAVSTSWKWFTIVGYGKASLT